jgi:ferric-dicitrate binding protein FerR (iron transport regulator)
MPDKKTVDNYGQINVAADWEQVKKRLSFRKTARRTSAPIRRRIRLWERTVAAAVAVCLLIAGGVYYTSSSSGQPEKREITFNQIIVPNGQKSQIILSDGSSVWLNSGSRMEFPSTFENDVRSVKLDGEAYFEVSKNEQQAFVVQTAGINVKVYGTTFNISSYSDEETNEVSLLSGSVSVSDSRNETEIFLKPNQKIVYEPKKHRFSQPTTVETETAAAWRNNKLIFENESLGKIFRKLERHYGTSIQVKDKTIEQYRYTGSFNMLSLEQVIKALQAIEKFNYKIEEGTTYIY